MKRPRRLLVTGHILVWSFASMLLPALDRKRQTNMATVTGTVLDARSETPLPGIEVSWKSRRVTSDPAGHYEIELPAGVREISFSAANRPPVRKAVFLREPGSRVRLDVLAPDSAGTRREVLALDRGSRLGAHGRDLDSDVPGDSTISLADEYGNDDQVLTLNTGSARVHSPVWLNANTIAFGTEGVFHRSEDSRLLGVYEFECGSKQIRQIASGIGAYFLSKSPRGEALAIGGQKDLYILGSLSDAGSLRRIFGLEANKGFILSVAWGPGDRIYFTVEDSIPLDDRHYRSWSRIASIKADGTGFEAVWASDPRHSYRYPWIAGGAEIIFSRFLLDGTQQELWSRNIRSDESQLVAEPGLRAVHLDSSAGRLYYVYQQDLHLRDLRSGSDWVIANSVREGDYLRAASSDTRFTWYP